MCRRERHQHCAHHRRAERPNIWTVGLDERGTKSYDEVDYKMDCAIVLGAEGKGLHDLVRRKCDFVVKIPMLGKVPSLNVSVAGADRDVRTRPPAENEAQRKKDEVV